MNLLSGIRAGALVDQSAVRNQEPEPSSQNVGSRRASKPAAGPAS